MKLDETPDKLQMKLTAGESNRRMVPASSDGSRSISLAWRKPVRELHVGRNAKLKGWGRNFGSINCSITVSSNPWLDDDVLTISG